MNWVDFFFGFGCGFAFGWALDLMGMFAWRALERKTEQMQRKYQAMKDREDK